MTERPPDKGLEFQDEGLSAQDIQAIKKITASLTISMKNYSLYPESHEICQNSFTNVKDQLDLFFKNHASLRFDVEANQLLYENETVLQGSPEEGNLPFLLFRDGILWLEFQSGLKLQEIKGFFKILNQYRTFQEEAEGDMVTALWDAGFPHIDYAASDVFFEGEPIIDISRLNVGEGSPPNAAPQPDERPVSSIVEEEENKIQISIADPQTDRGVWKLTAEEKKQMQDMVVEAEALENTEDVLEVALIVLSEQNSEEQFAIFFEFLKAEFQNLLVEGELQWALSLLDRLQEISLDSEMDKAWAVPLFERFFREISSPEVLEGLQRLLPVLSSMDPDQIQILRKVLLMLPPIAIPSIGPLLLQTDSLLIQKQLTDIIESMARRDVRPMEQLLEHPEETLVRKMVAVLGKLDGEAPAQILIKMIKNPSEPVRKKILKVLVDRKHQPLKDLFPLIEDPSEEIRIQALGYFGQFKNEEAEDLLLKYLKQGRFKISGPDHLRTCYLALGQCASSRSIPYLRGALLSQGWRLGSGRSLQRQCAATALFALGTAEAENILKKASRSLYPNIRFSYQKAAESYKFQV
jgi:hypothetical protein